MQTLSIHAAAPQAMLQRVPEEFRSVICDHERAAAILEHAMAYLIMNRFKRLRSGDEANRDAVKILCDARDILEYFSY